MSRVYKGIAETNGRLNWSVVVEDGGPPRLLDPGFQHGIRHSPDGFAWGYAGSGPAQLAFAILCDCCGVEYAMRWYQDFKQRVIAKLDMNQDFCMSEDAVNGYQEDMERAYAQRRNEL